MAAPKDATYLASQTNVENLKNLDEMKKAYELLCKQEAVLNDDLNSLLEQQVQLESKMASLHTMLPNLQLLHNDSQQLSNMVSFTSTLAENVSSKVRQLDLAKSRVSASMQTVEDILDLKGCTDGVQAALQDEDYEQAAAHVHRFLSLDENVIKLTETSEGSSLHASTQKLHEAQNKLKTIVNSKFDAAVHAGDIPSVERFFKIFPLVGMHEEGLSKFSKYLCSQLSEKADKNLKIAELTEDTDKRVNVIYADTLTMLFESIAKEVEIHQPLVETYYGPGRMYTMMQFLQKECDRQARKVLKHFQKQREFEKKTQRVQQSLMLGKSGIASDKLDPKDLDPLLAEITLLNARAELYLRFVRRRVTADLEVEVAGMEEEAQQARLAEVDKFIIGSELSRLMQELIGNYIMMEEYFMREMVVKAVHMDMTEDGQKTSSMVDDAFFIVKKCVRRAMSSSSVDGVCAMLNHACTLLETDFREVLYAKLRPGFPSGFDLAQAYNMVQSSIQQGKLQASDTEKDKAMFLVTLNNAEASCEYIKTLKNNLEHEISKLYGQAKEQQRAKLESCLTDLAAVSSKFKDVLDFGFSQLHANAVKPRIKPWVDTFLSTSHNLTEEGYSNYEANDPWVQGFIVNLDSLQATFKNLLTPSNYDTLVSHIANEVTTQLEKAVMKTSFNRLGGLQYDKELRSLVGYLTSLTTWTIRDKFARLTQMATILNLDRVGEILDYWGPNSGPLTWRLTPAEVRQVLSLRVDFRSEDIKRLKL